MPVRYIRVKTDTSALRPVATRSYGNIAILGPILVPAGTATVAPSTANQIVTLTPPGGQAFPANTTFTLSFGGQNTPPIPVTAPAMDVQTALGALSSVGSANVRVTGNAGGPYTILFQGTLAQNPGPVTATNPVAAGVTAGTTTVAPNTADQIVTLAPPSGQAFPPGTAFTLVFGGKTTSPILVTAPSADVQNAFAALSSVGSGNVTVSGNAGGPYTIIFQGTLAQNPGPVTATNPTPGGLPDTRANFVQINQPEPFSDAEAVALRCPGPLGASIQMAFRQSPGPALIYAVRTAASPQAADWTSALAAIQAQNVQLVLLAMQALDATSGALNNDGTPQGPIALLADHVQKVSRAGDGLERMGVAMLTNGVASPVASGKPLLNSLLQIDRMVYIAHKSTEDAAAAVAGVIAGYEPQISLLLKPVAIDSGVFSPAEIETISEALDTSSGSPVGTPETDLTPPQGCGFNWLTQTPLIPGGGFYMGEGYTGDPAHGVKWIDVRRTLDDITFQLKARLITAIGNLRLTRADLRTMIGLFEAVLIPLQNNNVIDNFQIDVRLLNLLDKDPNTLTDSEKAEIANARNNRMVSAIVAVVYAGAVHRLNITLKLTSV
jgi:hypothetical protein